MLQEELRNTAIRITRIQPGSVDTPSFDGEIVPREKFIKPAQIADAIEWIIRLPESVQVEEMIIRPTDKNW
jgi:NADP-dependent 3-hydroxy acid dehydrogenase YdfG